ncbi:hypothetical protein N1029_08650, partial [Herbiconiux sp. CPCC 203406]|nr:hypothetical protein [Herbiconiux oxytropis]
FPAPAPAAPPAPVVFVEPEPEPEPEPGPVPQPEAAPTDAPSNGPVGGYDPDDYDPNDETVLSIREALDREAAEEHREQVENRPAARPTQNPEEGSDDAR